MGKGGRGKSSAKGSTSAAASASKSDDDDDKLLDATIAENKIARQLLAAQQAAQQLGSSPAGATWWGEGGPPKRTMEPNQIVQKLNAIPTFCLLSGEDALLGLRDLTDESGQRKICTWFTDPTQATEMLTQCKAHSPDIAEGLHLGITPLGMAYAFACGWAELPFSGDKQVHGSSEAYKGTKNLTELMRQQAVAQGFEARTWHVPVFSCPELATPARMPFFLSQKALAEGWLVTGRKLSDLEPDKVAVCDLGVVVHQMQTGAFDGSKVQFIAERKAIALVNECKQAGAATTPVPPPPSSSKGEEEEEPSREEAVAAIQQALLAAVLAGKGEGEGASPGGPPPPPPQSSSKGEEEEEEPSREEAVAAIQQALLATVLAGKGEPPPLT